MAVEPTLLTPAVHGDDRGFFLETWRADTLDGFVPVQANHSRSARGVVRGLHFQIGSGLAKLVRCSRGAIHDVVVDVRPDSPRRGEWQAFELSDSNHHALLVPVGFAHGFCVLSDLADVFYMQDGYYDPEKERGIHYADPDVGIEWPLDDLQPSPRDAGAPRLAEIAGDLHFDR